VLNRPENVEIVINRWVSESGGLGNGRIDSCNKDEVACGNLICWNKVSKKKRLTQLE